MHIVLQDNLIPFKKKKKKILRHSQAKGLLGKKKQNPIMIICASWYGH